MPRTPYIAIATGVLSLRVLRAVPHATETRRLLRRRQAQERGAEQMDRFAEQS